MTTAENDTAWQIRAIYEDGVSKLKRQYEEGEESALLRAILLCAQGQITMPDWVASEFSVRYSLIINGEVKSLDDAFGAPFPKSTNLAAFRKRLKRRWDVWFDVERIRETEPSTPVDTALFERVGNRYGLGKTLAAEYYYEMKKELFQ